MLPQFKIFYLHKILIRTVKTDCVYFGFSLVRCTSDTNTVVFFFSKCSPRIPYPFCNGIFSFHGNSNFIFILCFANSNVISSHSSLMLTAAFAHQSKYHLFQWKKKPHQFIHPLIKKKSHTSNWRKRERDRIRKKSQYIKSHWIIKWKCLAG